MKKVLIIAVLVVLGLASLAAIGVALSRARRGPAAAMPKTYQEAVAMVTSDKFRGLSEPDREAYFAKLQELSLKADPKEREEASKKIRNDPQARDAMRQNMYALFEGYGKKYAKGNEEERKTMVDAAIKMQGQRPRNRGGSSGDQGKAGADAAGPSKPPSEEERKKAEEERKKAEGEWRAWIRDLLQHGNPQKQAYIVEFMKAIEVERKKREQQATPAPGS